MHVILRYEIERALIKGELKVDEVSGRGSLAGRPPARCRKRRDPRPGSAPLTRRPLRAAHDRPTRPRCRACGMRRCRPTWGRRPPTTRRAACRTSTGARGVSGSGRRQRAPLHAPCAQPARSRLLHMLLLAHAQSRGASWRGAWMHHHGPRSQIGAPHSPHPCLPITPPRSLWLFPYVPPGRHVSGARLCGRTLRALRPAMPCRPPPLHHPSTLPACLPAFHPAFQVCDADLPEGGQRDPGSGREARGGRLQASAGAWEGVKGGSACECACCAC